MGDFLNQPSFASGEIAPELYGRVDQDLYYIGLRTCRNFIVRQYGGVANRPGTKFIGEGASPDKKVRLIPFQFNELQTYVLEFGDEYMRVIRNGGEVLETAQNVTGATKADPCVLTVTGHGYSDGDDVYVSGLGGMVELNGRTVRVANSTTNTFELVDMQGNNIDSSAFTAYTSGGTVARVYTVTTPWGEDDLFDLNFAQSNDVLTVVHEDYFPRDITRTDHDAWTITAFNNVEGPFKTINSTATTVYANNATGTGTLTASSGIFTSDMVGELFYIEQEPSKSTERWEVATSVSANDIRRAGSHYYEAINSATTGTVRPSHIEGRDYDGDGAVEWEYLHSGFGVVEITSFSSATSVGYTVKKRLPDLVLGSGNATTLWAKQAWSAAEGYPQAVSYHKQRLVFGGTTQQPNGIWFSGTGLRTYFGKSNPILDDETISLLLDTTQVNAVRHLLPLAELVVLTSASEQVLNGPDNLILATDPPVARTQGYTGSSKVVPIIIGNTALFVQDMGSVVRSLQYNLDTDGYTGIDLSARSPHLFRRKTVVDWAFQRHPLSVIWTVMSDGTLNGFTFMEEQQVYAWHRHDTDGEFESVACIREGEETAAYVVVKRVVDGNTTRYIERFESREFNSISDAYFVDCGLTYDGRNFSLEIDGYDENEQPQYEKVASTATTITISGGTNWDKTETLTLTSSASLFASGDVGDQIVFRYENDNGTEIALRLNITAYTSATVVSAQPVKTVPTTHRNTARTDWEFARDTFRPLNHLEGKEVAILADGNIVDGKTVQDGAVVLDTPASVVHIGLPYKSRLETLDMAQPQGQTKAKQLRVNRVFLTVREARAVFVGTDGFDDLIEYKQRSPGIGYDAAIPAETDVFEVVTSSSWSSTGRIAVEQNLPLPVSITCITPEVTLGSNG